MTTTALSPFPPYTMALKPVPFSGFTLSDGRRGGFCWGERPRCTNPVPGPEGHRLKPREPVLTEAIVTCRHRVRHGAQECGVMHYVRRFPQDRDEDLLWLVVEVTPDHVRRLKDQPKMLFLERMQIIGCVLPGVDVFDLPFRSEDDDASEAET